MKSYSFKRSILLICVLVMVTHIAKPQSTKKMEAKTIHIGVIDLSFYKVVGALVEKFLQDEGYQTTVTYGTHANIFPKMASGDIDLLVAAWLPNAHEDYWTKFQNDATILGTLYTEAKLFWAVPDYIPIEKVESVGDLTRASVKQKMRMEIINVGPGSGLETKSLEMMDAYGLQDEGYSIRTGSAEEWSGQLQVAYPLKEWLVVPLWQPQYLNQQYKMRILKEPKLLLGAEDTAHLIGNKTFANGLNDETKSLLEGIKLTIEEVSEMDYQLNIEKKSLEFIANEWQAKLKKKE